MKFNKINFFILFISFVNFTSSCKGEKMKNVQNYTSDLKTISVTDWKKLSEVKIYFGHQSIGNNIMEGINELMQEYPEIILNILDETSAPPKFNNPGFIHNSNLGENNYPELKMESFEKLLKNAEGRADIAFMKFCFVDIDSKTDINRLFETYKDLFSRLTNEYPETKFIHLTVPLLKQSAPTIKNLIKKILGKDGGFYADAHNISRNKFNSFLRNEYPDSLIFDLAAIESTYPDGLRESFTHNGDIYYSLIPEYTDDGGHLNRLGRKIVAEKLLFFIINEMGKK